MSPLNWQRIEGLFHEALLRPAAERDRWLGEQCSGDEELLLVVRRFLTADADATTLTRIDRAIRGSAAEVYAGVNDVGAGQLGAYRLEREIATGGMGSVYLAVRADASYEKRVAVKILSRAAVGADAEVNGEANREIEARFRQERQILASLDHPYICRLLDGGVTADGRPYFVLDYIDGLPLTVFASERRLTVRQCCELFVKVCEAVSYAHHHLVVHRDLKPANILVTADGTPKLLDFGIAKILDTQGQDAVTQAVFGWMTPAYASPEQVQGAAVTAAADVYSLGAILYELLTGRGPHELENHSAAELMMVVCERDPVPASRWNPAIGGDLDRILLKALAKAPSRRYGSVEQLAADIGRYFTNEPVLARKPERLYRLGKFAQRHAAALVASVAVLMALGSAAAMSYTEAREAQRLSKLAVMERDRATVEEKRAGEAAREAKELRAMALHHAANAERQRGQAELRVEELRSLIHHFLFDIDKALENLPGTTVARQVVAGTALRYLDEMAAQPHVSEELRHDLAAAYERVGDLQGHPAKPSLGDFVGAMASYRKALAIRWAYPLSAVSRRMELMVLSRMAGYVELRLGNRAAAGDLFSRGLALAGGEWAEEPGLWEATAGLLYQQGEWMEITGSAGQALGNFERSAELLGKVLRRDPGNERLQAARAMAQTQMGRVQSISGARKEGLAKLRRSVEQLRPIVAAAPTHFAYRRNLLFTLRALADQLRGPEGSEGRDLAGALRAIEEAEKLAAAAAAADPGNQLAARDVAVTASFAARIHKDRHDWKAAGLALERAARSMQQILDRYPGDRSAVDSLGYYQAELGEGAKLRGDYVQAEAHFRRAIGIYRALLASGSQDRYHRFNIALASRSLGECLNAQGRAGGAVHYEQALSILGALRAADPATTMFQSEWEKTSNLHRERVSR